METTLYGLILFVLLPDLLFAEEYGLYSCPSHIADLKTGNCLQPKPEPESLDDITGLKTPVRLAYVKVGDVCYDWTDDDVVNKLNCSDPHFRCCLEFGNPIREGTTDCAEEIPIFLRVWRIIGFKYLLWGFDSERFADILASFLSSCDRP